MRPVIRRVMCTARRLCVRFVKTNFRFDWLYKAMVRLEARAPPPALAA